MPYQALSDLVLEHEESAWARRLRRNRLRVALAIAAVEGILVLAGTIPWWLVVLLALASVVLYVSVRSERRSELVQLAWIAAFSQLALVIVPVAAAVLTAVAVAVVVLFAIVALVALARDRR